jgi:hypothetical protein
MSTVVAFRPRRGPWLAFERVALDTIQRNFERQGMMTDWAQGIGAGDAPWRVFYGRMTGGLVAQISRTREGYKLTWSDRTTLQADNLEKLVFLARSEGVQLDVSA